MISTRLHTLSLNTFTGLSNWFAGKKMYTGLKVIKLFSCSTELSTKFTLLINVKMPTTVGISTFISMINATLESPKSRNFFICWYFSFMSS